jgi:hypothetical protein
VKILTSNFGVRAFLQAIGANNVFKETPDLDVALNEPITVARER